MSTAAIVGTAVGSGLGGSGLGAVIVARIQGRSARAVAATSKPHEVTKGVIDAFVLGLAEVRSELQHAIDESTATRVELTATRAELTVVRAQYAECEAHRTADRLASDARHDADQARIAALEADMAKLRRDLGQLGGPSARTPAP